MNSEVTSITERDLQDNSARILRKLQARSAMDLKENEKGAALALLKRQVETPETDIGHSQQEAAEALLANQDSAATSLVNSQSNAAIALDGAQRKAAQILDEKTETIRMLTGDYNFQKL